MAYTQQHQYTYRDSLEKGDAEKVIKGEYFDDEFSAIEASFESLPGADGGEITPDAPGYGNVVFQDRTEDQQVVSKFTFQGEKPTENGSGNRFVVDPASRTARFYSGQDVIGSDGNNPWDVQVDGSLVVYHNSFPPRSMAYTPSGMSRATGVYIAYRHADDPDNPINPDPQPAKWLVKPNLDVEGDLNVIGGITAGGDLTLNGNIIIDGGTIVDPDGNTSGGFWSPSGAEFIRYSFPSGGDGLQAGGIEIHNEVTDNVWYWEGFRGYCRIGRRGGSTYLRISEDGELMCGNINSSGEIWADKFIKNGGTASQLLCADGSVVAKTDYYDKTEADGRYVRLTGAQTIAGIKTFNADIRCKANVYAYYGSDERLKDDITPMPVGLIDTIKPATWKWKEDGQSSAGVVAQQLQQAGLGDWVREAPNGDLGVDYNALIGMLIAEVQDLKRRLSDD